MLLANIAVATRIAKSFPAFSLLRKHPPPNDKKIDELNMLLETKQIKLNIETSKQLSESLENTKIESDPSFNEIIRILTTRCMNQAIYISSGTLSYNKYYHYGLSTPIYTHFTSPIRRYADIVVHRLLAASIGVIPLSSQLNSRNIDRICSNLNSKKRSADIAGRESTRLHCLNFFKNKSVTVTGRVLNISRNGFTTYIPRYGIEGKVYLSNHSEESVNWKYNEEVGKITSSDGKHTVGVFDEVEVQISTDFTRPNLPKVVYLCLNPPIHIKTELKEPKTNEESKKKSIVRTKRTTKY